MIKWRALLVFLFCATLLAGAAYSTPPSKPLQDIASAIANTIRTNPDILQAEATARASKWNINITTGGYLPKIDMRIANGQQELQGPTTGASNIILARHEKSLTASQLLWDGWSTVYQIASSKFQFRSSFYQAAEKRQLTALRATEVYLEVLKFRTLSQLAEQNVKKHRITLRKVTLRYRGGAGEKADIALAKGRLTQATSTLLANEGQLANGMASFVAVVGLPAEHLILPKLPKIPATLDAAVDNAYHHSPSIRIAYENLRTARANKNAARTAFLPRVSLEGSWSHNRNLDGLAGNATDARGMVVMQYNLFNGGATHAGLQRATHGVVAAEQAYAQARRATRENIATAWNNLHYAEQQAIQLSQQVTNTRQVLVAYQKQFELGQRSLLNLVDTERDLFNANTQLVNSRFEVLANAYRLLATMGVLESAVF